MFEDSPESLEAGDCVRFRGAILQTRGIIVEAVGEEHVNVLWDGAGAPTTHRRSHLELDGD